VNFTVKWEAAIRHELHELWAVAPDPAAVRVAADTAERLFGIDPFGAGRHLSEGLWRVDVPPLVINYTIDPDQNEVKITDVFHPA